MKASERNLVSEFTENWAEKLKDKIEPVQIAKLGRSFDVVCLWGAINGAEILRIIEENQINPEEFLEGKLKGVE